MAARAEREATKDALDRRRRQILDETADRLESGADPDDDVMPRLFRTLTAERIVDAALGFVVVDPARPLQLGFIEGFDPQLALRCGTVRLGQGICGTVALTRSAVHVTGIQASADPISELVRTAGFDACASEPLIVGEQLLGTLCFASRVRRSFAADDLLLFRKLAKQLAKARAKLAKGRDHPLSLTLARHRWRQNRLTFVRTHFPADAGMPTSGR
ncbi:MAG: GAF domain-containing protein [Sphingomicrobium sp.]